MVLLKFHAHRTESFHIWKLRLAAALETKHCLGIVTSENQQPKVGDDDSKMVTKLQAFEKRKRRASAILITSLGDKPLKTVQKNSTIPRQMCAVLCARYASKATGIKLGLFTAALSKTKEPESLSDHISELETIFSQLEDAGQSLNELRQFAILLSSIKDDRHYEETIAAIPTMNEGKTNWDFVTVRLLEESKEKENLGHSGERT